MPSEARNVHLPYHQRSQAHHRLLAALAARYTPAGRVMEVGCGLGYSLEELHRLRPDLKLCGADQDEVCLEQTRGRLPELDAVRMGEEGFDVASLGDGYETVLMSHVLEHLPRPAEAVERLLGVVSPGGHLILGVPNPVTPLNFLFAMLRVRRVNPGHMQIWDRGHWANFLENRVGAEVVEYAHDEVRIFPVRLKQRLRPLEWIQIGLAKLFPWWSFTLFAVIRRPAEPA